MFVRAHDKPFYVFPGGKQEVGESIEAALARELVEELRVSLREVRPLGVVEGRTPDGRELAMHLYTGDVAGAPRPSHEIVEIRWFSRTEILKHQHVMTPMTLEKVLPFLKQAGLF